MRGGGGLYYGHPCIVCLHIFDFLTDRGVNTSFGVFGKKGYFTLLF